MIAFVPENVAVKAERRIKKQIAVDQLIEEIGQTLRRVHDTRSGVDRYRVRKLLAYYDLLLGIDPYEDHR